MPGIDCQTEGDKYTIVTIGSGTYLFKVKKDKSDREKDAYHNSTSHTPALFSNSTSAVQ